VALAWALAAVPSTTRLAIPCAIASTPTRREAIAASASYWPQSSRLPRKPRPPASNNGTKGDAPRQPFESSRVPEKISG